MGHAAEHDASESAAEQTDSPPPPCSTGSSSPADPSSTSEVLSELRTLLGGNGEFRVLQPLTAALKCQLQAPLQQLASFPLEKFPTSVDGKHIKRLMDVHCPPSHWDDTESPLGRQFMGDLLAAIDNRKKGQKPNTHPYWGSSSPGDTSGYETGHEPADVYHVDDRWERFRPRGGETDDDWAAYFDMFCASNL